MLLTFRVIVLTQVDVFVVMAMCMGVIVRVAFDESSLTGKLTDSTRFPEGDIRGSYFAGDRLERTVRRVEANGGAIRADAARVIPGAWIGPVALSSTS